ncbi:MAG: PaaI family thioesterase [Lachnospiraceae bacterium]|nr:PaaI family thioesterase [Lachnospiraceae bacterium]
MGSIEEARKIFNKDSYAVELTGCKIDSIGESYAKCSLELTGMHKNAYGGVMGGAIYTLADFAFAVASNYEKEGATVSVVGQASFMSAPKGNILYAEAELIKDGRSNCFYNVTITDDTGRIVAVVTFNGAHVPKMVGTEK